MAIHIMPSKDASGSIAQHQAPFKNKAVNGGMLFKRVHGVNSGVIAANSIGYIFLSIPYPVAKFNGAEIMNTDLGDTVDFFVLDTAINAYSGAPVETFGANFPLNQFGFSVCMPSNNQPYKNTSEYDADLYQSMEVMCVYSNNSNAAKTVYMNVEIHEVK